MEPTYNWRPYKREQGAIWHRWKRKRQTWQRLGWCDLRRWRATVTPNWERPGIGFFTACRGSTAAHLDFTWLSVSWFWVWASHFRNCEWIHFCGFQPPDRCWLVTALTGSNTLPCIILRCAQALKLFCNFLGLYAPPSFFFQYTCYWCFSKTYSRTLRRTSDVLSTGCYMRLMNHWPRPPKLIIPRMLINWI